VPVFILPGTIGSIRETVATTQAYPATLTWELIWVPRWIVKNNIRLVGIDYLSIGSYREGDETH
jgi:hypothetical protein